MSTRINMNNASCLPTLIQQKTTKDEALITPALRQNWRKALLNRKSPPALEKLADIGQQGRET